MAVEHMLRGRTAAILVVYRWRGPLEDVLQVLGRTVASVVVVDNAEQAHLQLPELTDRHGALLMQAGNRGGLAGAYNMALAHLREQYPGHFNQVVFLDDDSDPTVLDALLRDPVTIGLLQDASTAAVAPAYRDRATGMRGKYIQLQRFGMTYLSRHFTDLRQVAFVINSMSVWRMTALQRIGCFNEMLAVDHVDTEYCLRARACGLRVWVHGGHEFAHAIGQRRKFKFLGREMQAGGHDPDRRRLIGRNTAWLARTWCWKEPSFAFLCLTRLAYEAVGILMAEDRKAEKLLALTMGALAGLFLPLRS
jgi:rhamnosyltransferase